MFTGIIQERGKIQKTIPGRLWIEAGGVVDGLRVGDSVAINGACLTVTSLTGSSFTVDVAPETVRRTTLGGLTMGDEVNVESALALGGRLGGHLVLGHVDDTGRVLSVAPEQDAYIIRIGVSARLMRYLAVKGFVAVDGVSLTIADLDDFSFSASLVPYTFNHTTLRARRPGDLVNLEVDVLARYLERLKEREGRELTLEYLAENGF